MPRSLTIRCQARALRCQTQTLRTRALRCQARTLRCQTRALWCQARALARALRCQTRRPRCQARPLAFAALLAAGTAVAADHYSAREIPGLGGGQVFGNGLGEQGQVVGESTSPADSITHAFATGPDGVGVVDLCPADATYCSASAINRQGRVIGAYAGHSAGASIGFVADVDGGRFHRVAGILDPRVWYVQLNGLNDRGQIVGYSTGHGAMRGWVTGADGRPVVDFGDYTGEDVRSLAIAIDDGGGVLAFVQRAPGIQYLSDHGRSRRTLPGLDSNAAFFAPDGAIAGSGPSGTGADHALYLPPPWSTAVDLGTLGGDRSQTMGVASGGRVVGFSTDASGQPRAFVYDPDHGMRDLNGLVDLPAGVVANYGRAINERGQIVVSDGFRTWLLTPDD